MSGFNYDPAATKNALGIIDRQMRRTRIVTVTTTMITDMEKHPNHHHHLKYCPNSRRIRSHCYHRHLPHVVQVWMQI